MGSFIEDGGESIWSYVLILLYHYHIVTNTDWFVFVFGGTNMAQSKRRLFCFGIPMMICLAIIINGCSDDDPAQPGSQIYLTFENIWPAAVGQYWVFDLDEKQFEGGNLAYDRLEDVPPLPTMTQLYAALQDENLSVPLEAHSGTMRWEVTSDATVHPDTTVMEVESHIDILEGNPRSPHGLGMGPSWRHSGNRIASYGFGQLGWVHLEGSLKPGHEFEVQLAEGLAQDIWLTSRIWKMRSFEVMGQVVPNCVECFYVLDMGIQQGTDENGEPLGFSHPYKYGVTIYAPEIGPVYCKEKFLTGPDNEWAGGTMFVRVATLVNRGGQ